jgi:hypothetical protein
MMELEHAELTRPAPIDLIAAEAVDASLELAEREIAMLRTQAQEAAASASELEARLVEAEVDPETATWMMMRFQSFLGRLWSEAEAELDAVRAAATREAARIRARGSSRAFSFRGAIGAPSSAWLDDLADRAIADAEQWLSWSAGSVAASRSDASPARPAVVVAEARAPVLMPAPAVVDVQSSPAADGEAFAELSELGSPDSPEDSDAVEGDTTSPFWTEETTERWWRRRRPSKATVLQTGAVGVLALAACVHFA